MLLRDREFRKRERGEGDTLGSPHDLHFFLDQILEAIEAARRVVAIAGMHGIDRLDDMRVEKELSILQEIVEKPIRKIMIEIDLGDRRLVENSEKQLWLCSPKL